MKLKSKHRRRLNFAEDLFLRENYASMSNRELAVKLNLAVVTVRYFAMNRGLKKGDNVSRSKARRLTKTQKIYIDGQYRAKTVEELSEKIRVREITISNYIKKYHS